MMSCTAVVRICGVRVDEQGTVVLFSCSIGSF